MAKIYTRQEVRRRRTNFKVFAGIYDFLGVVAGIVVIIVCIILLRSLIIWAIRDGKESFASLWDIFSSALILPE